MANKSNPHYEGKPLIPFDGKEKGEMTIDPKDLNIVWGGDNRYWKVNEEVGKPAELYQVSWLEVTGSVQGIKLNKDYEVGFKMSFTPDAFGWSNFPTFIMVKRGKKGKFAWDKHVFDSSDIRSFEFKKTLKGMAVESQSPDPESQTELQKLYFGMYEVWSGKWKGGLKIECAFVRELP